MSARQVLEPLRQLNVLHLELLESGKKKRQVLIDNKLDELSAILQEESRLIRKVSETEQLWVEAAKRFFMENGLQPEPELTAKDLMDLVSDPGEKQALEEVRRELTGTMHELKQLNALNQQLIEQSLAYVDYTIELLTGMPDEPTYRNPNDSKGPERRSVFDRKT